MTTSKDEIQCPVCGTQVALGVNVCPNCGATLGNGKGSDSSAPSKVGVPLSESIQLFIEIAHEQERAGNLKGALDAYRRARALGAEHQGVDSSAQIMIQMLDSLIQRTEELIKENQGKPGPTPVLKTIPGAGVFAQTHSPDALPPAGEWQPATPPKKPSWIRWVIAVVVVGVLCLLLVVGGGLTYLGTKGQGPLAGLATDTPTRTPTRTPTPTPTPTFTYTPTNTFTPTRTPTRTPTFTPAPAYLYTTFAGGNGAHGNMFDIYAYKDLYITGFDFNIDSESEEVVEVWFKTGSYYGYETSSSAWFQVTAQYVIGQGAGNPTHVDIDPFFIGAGESYGVYFWLRAGTSGGVDYSDGTEVYSNSDLQISSGTGNGADWGSVYRPRIWNGVIYYRRVGN